MVAKAKTPMNGSKSAELGAETTPVEVTTATETVGRSNMSALEVEAEDPVDEAIETLAVIGTVADATETATAALELEGAPPEAAAVLLNQQDAISQINTANHDLVTLLEPLLTSVATQKRLTELMVRQVRLSEANGATWLSHVKRLLEAKGQASQSLVRSLIAEG